MTNKNDKQMVLRNDNLDYSATGELPVGDQRPRVRT